MWGRYPATVDSLQTILVAAKGKEKEAERPGLHCLRTRFKLDKNFVLPTPSSTRYATNTEVYKQPEHNVDSKTPANL
jgi:hypothetical protein